VGECFFWYRLTRVVPDKIHRAIKWLCCVCLLLALIPDGHLTAFCVTFCRSPLIITLVLLIFTLMPLFSTLSFHSRSLLIRSSLVSAMTATSSAYNNSHHKATLNSFNNASITITNSKALNAKPWYIPIFTSKPLE